MQSLLVDIKYVQVTNVGFGLVMKHRKAVLQLAAEPYVPALSDEMASSMRDYVRIVGGPIFKTIVQQLAHDDQGLADAVDVITQSANCLNVL